MPDPIQGDASDLAAWSRAQLEVPRELAREVGKSFKKILIKLVSDTERSIKGGFSPGTQSQDNVVNRSGDLRRSFDLTVEDGVGIKDVSGFMFSTALYSSTQEFGTVGAGGSLPTIRPKKAKYLTIPLPDNLDPSGITLRTAREVLSNPQGFFLQTEEREQAGKGPLIVENEGGELQFMFTLVDEVDIKPRLGIRDRANSSSFRSFVSREIGRGVARALERADDGRQGISRR